jgi:hypothetical protein
MLRMYAELTDHLVISGIARSGKALRGEGKEETLPAFVYEDLRLSVSTRADLEGTVL